MTELVTMPGADSLARFADNAFVATMAVEVLALLAWALLSARVVVRSREAAPVAVAAGGGASRGQEPPVRGDRAAGPETTRHVATALTVLATTLLTAAVVARGLAAGRAPWGNMFEFVTTGALSVSLAFLVVLARRPVHAAGPWVTALVLAALGLAMTVLYTPVDELVPVLDSYWLVIHVAAAIVSGGVFTVSAFTALLFLLRRRADAGGRLPLVGGYARALPRAEVLDRVTHGAVVLAFPVWTFAVIAGAIWAEDAWGRYWGWDPKETWAFITWVMYAAYLHAQSTAGWRGTRATWFSVAGYAAFVFNFFGVNLWISGLHSYAGV